MNTDTQPAPAKGAFHNNHALKDLVVSGLQDKVKRDRMLHGVGWSEGGGCAVACTLQGYSHEKNGADYQERFGLPRYMARLHELVFEAMRGKRSLAFGVNFIAAIPVGTPERAFDVVWPRLTYHMARTLKGFNLMGHAEGKGPACLRRIAVEALDLLYERANGKLRYMEMAYLETSIDLLLAMSDLCHENENTDARYVALSRNDERRLLLLKCLLKSSPSFVDWKAFRDFLFSPLGSRQESFALGDYVLDLLGSLGGPLPEVTFWQAPAEEPAKPLPASITDLLATPAPAATVAKVPEPA